MSPFVLQIVFCVLGIMLQLVAMYYAGRPLMRALQGRKINELPKLAPAAAHREEEPTPVAIPWERPEVEATITRPLSAIVAEPRDSNAILRAGLLTKTEKVAFIRR